MLLTKAKAATESLLQRVGVYRGVGAPSWAMYKEEEVCVEWGVRGLTWTTAGPGWPCQACRARGGPRYMAPGLHRLPLQGALVPGIKAPEWPAACEAFIQAQDDICEPPTQCQRSGRGWCRAEREGVGHIRGDHVVPTASITPDS